MFISCSSPLPHDEQKGRCQKEWIKIKLTTIKKNPTDPQSFSLLLSTYTQTRTHALTFIRSFFCVQNTNLLFLIHFSSMYFTSKMRTVGSFLAECLEEKKEDSENLFLGF